MRSRLRENHAFNSYTIGFSSFAAIASLNAYVLAIGCPVKALTGIDCPGCGATRAVKAVFNGDLVNALSFNSFILVLLPVLAVLYLVFAGRVLRDGPAAKDPFSNKVFLWSLAIIGILWTVFRLTPWGEWFRP